MTNRGVVFDLGYKPYDGERLGRTGAVRAVVRDGLRRVLGLRRRARSKIFPWGLFGLALFPAGFFLAFSVITGDLLESEENFFGPVEYFSFNGTVTLLFIALAAAELLVPDRTYGTLSVYASRPLRMIDYLGARGTSLAILVSGFLLLPQILLFIGQALVDSDGFFDYASSNLDVLWQSVAASVVYFAAFAPIAFLVASIAKKSSYAAGFFLLGISVINGITAGLVDEAEFDIAGLISLNHHPRYVTDWLFDENSHAWIPERAGFDPWVSLLVIAVVAAGCTAVLVRRYRRLT